MSVWTYEQWRKNQQEIELKALIALAQFGKETQKHEALKHLENIAYPDLIEIEKEEKYFGNCMTCGGSTGDSALLEKCDCKQ